jgi:hypothetical protein
MMDGVFKAHLTDLTNHLHQQFNWITDVVLLHVNTCVKFDQMRVEWDELNG